MGVTAFLMHPASALHDTGWGHPEHQGRLRALAGAVDRDMVALRGRVEPLEAPPAEPEDALRVHSEGHLERVRAAVERAARTEEIVSLDADTRVSAASWDAAMGALGAALAAGDAVAGGRFRNAFVATRPPGHHATPDRAMGFCLVNHVACLARRLQADGHAERILIVDWDVHHGNGTQDVFWTDPTVFYLSLHQSPHYPGTGREVELGAGEGAGFTKNVELRAGTPAERYGERFDEALDEVLEVFAPDFVLVSAGFDCLAGDPLGGLLLEPEDLHAVTVRLMVATGAGVRPVPGGPAAPVEASRGGQALEGGAEEPEGGPGIVVCLEGGYDPVRTGRGAVSVIRALAGLPPLDG